MVSRVYVMMGGSKFIRRGGVNFQRPNLAFLLIVRQQVPVPVIGEQVIGMQVVIGFPTVEGLVARPDAFPALDVPHHASPQIRIDAHRQTRIVA